MGIQFTALIGEENQGRSTWIDIDGWEFFGWSYGNARPLLSLLGLPMRPDDLGGSCSIHVARRAVMQAKARFDRAAPQHTRAVEKLYRRPSEDNRGITPIRQEMGFVCGLDLEGIRFRLDEFARYVEAAAKAGAQSLAWG